MSGRPFDAILFDLGSTLIYFNAQWPEVLPQAYAELVLELLAAGIALDRDNFLSKFSTSIQEYYVQRETEFIEYTTNFILKKLLAESGYPDLPEDLLGRALAAMYGITQTHWVKDPETIATLEWLRAQGYRLGLISNAGDDADVQSLVDKAGLRPYFEVVLSSAAVGIRKPNPRIFHLALEELGVQAERAAMVGDTLGADILGAQNAGIFSIWVMKHADAPGNRAHLDTIRPDAVIQTLGELPGLLVNLEGA